MQVRILSNGSASSASEPVLILYLNVTHSYSLDSFGVGTGTRAIQLYIKTCLHRTCAIDSYSKSVFLARRTLCGVQRFNGINIIYPLLPVHAGTTKTHDPSYLGQV